MAGSIYLMEMSRRQNIGEHGEHVVCSTLPKQQFGVR